MYLHFKLKQEMLKQRNIMKTPKKADLLQSAS